MSKVAITVHVESCCQALAASSESLPAVGGAGGALAFAGSVVYVVGYVVVRSAVHAARLTAMTVGAALLLGAGVCHVVGLLGPVLRVGGQEAIALARGGE
jgi:hypothetical protein